MPGPPVRGDEPAACFPGRGDLLDAPLSPPPLNDEPGPATGRSGANPDGTSTRRPGPASRTKQVSSLISAARQAWSYAFSGRATWPRRFSEWASTARICAARKPSMRSSTCLPSNITERTINAVYAQV